MCLKQLEEIELRLAEWQTSGFPPDDFPLNDYQKIDLIKQRLTDVKNILACRGLATNLDFETVDIEWEVLVPRIDLGETRAAILNALEIPGEDAVEHGEPTLF